MKIWLAALLGALSACAPAPGNPSLLRTAPAPSATTATTGTSSSGPAASSPERRAEDLLRQMTLEEKLDYIGGDRSLYIRPIARLGIPEIKMSDGPSGCRNWGPSTAYPAAVALAATFDTATAEKTGAAVGRDCRARGVHILLAPGVNIQRSPLGGRNFEYLGEDPFLAGKTAASYIRGVQSEGVLATVKHFAGNNQEWDRNGISSEIDERTLREIYFPAFERAVHEGRVGAVMTAYNLLNGIYCSQDAWLIRQVLEQQWGFSGLVMSDWGAVHDAVAAVNGGLDLEMPSGKYMNRENLAPQLAAHAIDIAAVDDQVRRILRTIAAAGFLDRPQKRDDIPLDDRANAEVALETARRSVVLLKNAGNLLPLDRAKLKRIAVIGPNAQPAVVGGSGSAFVTTSRAISVLDGIQQALPGVQVDSSPGVRRILEFHAVGKPCFAGPVSQEVFLGRELSGKPVSSTRVDRIDFGTEGVFPAPGYIENYSVRWTGQVAAPVTGAYEVMTNTDDGVRVLVDAKVVIDDWKEHPTTTNLATLQLQHGLHSVVIEYFQGTGGAVAQFGFAAASKGDAFEGGAQVSALARKADVVIVSVGFGQGADTNSAGTAFASRWPPAWARNAGLVEAEDSDRPFELPAAQLETIRLAVAANPRTVVVVNAGGGVDLQKFVDRVPALLAAWYPGQEGGRAIADVLLGDVDPSGKLPMTFARRYADYPSASYYNLDQAKKTPYTEGIFVGYRGFDAHEIAPMFPFGYGLSYTTFAYSNLQVSPGPTADGSASLRLEVTNTGPRAGDEVVEVYVAPPKESVPRPPRELKGFARVSLGPGEKKEVSIALEPRAFAFWDDRAKDWAVEAGSFEVEVGASSRDIRLRQALAVSARVLPP
jgi:beta-glucosidase